MHVPDASATAGTAGCQSMEAARQPQNRVRRPYSEFTPDPAVLKALRAADDAAASQADEPTREQFYTPAVSSRYIAWSTVIQLHAVMT